MKLPFIDNANFQQFARNAGFKPDIVQQDQVQKKHLEFTETIKSENALIKNINNGADQSSLAIYQPQYNRNAPISKSKTTSKIHLETKDNEKVESSENENDLLDDETMFKELENISGDNTSGRTAREFFFSSSSKNDEIRNSLPDEIKLIKKIKTAFNNERKETQGKLVDIRF